jgi:cell division protein FtsB
MKKLIGFLLLLSTTAVAGVSGYVFTQRLSPEDAVARVQALHAENPDLEDHIGRYESAMRAIGTPFRAIGSLSGLLERVEQAREFSVVVAGTQIRPWQSIQQHTPGAGLVQIALDSAGAAVRLGSSVDSECEALESAAVAYTAAWGSANEAASAENVIALSAAAEALAAEIHSLRDQLDPATEALAEAVTQLDEVKEWLNDVTPDGARESLVIAGMRAAVGALSAAAGEPYEAVAGFAHSMDEDAAILLEVAALDDELRSVFFDEFLR